MSNASLDENGIPTLICALNTDGTTITRVKVNSSTHTLKVVDDSTGSDHGTINALRDENSKVCLMAVSSADGVTPVAVYADSSGNLLIDSN